MKKVKMLLEVLSTPSIIFPFGVLRNFLIAEAKISWEKRDGWMRFEFEVAKVKYSTLLVHLHLLPSFSCHFWRSGANRMTT